MTVAATNTREETTCLIMCPAYGSTGSRVSRRRRNLSRLAGGANLGDLDNPDPLHGSLDGGHERRHHCGVRDEAKALRGGALRGDETRQSIERQDQQRPPVT